MQSLVTIHRISSVNLSALRITDNYAAQYLTFDGDLSGHFTVDNVAVIDNMNNGPFPSNAMINVTNYIRAVIKNFHFVHNQDATIALRATLSDSLLLQDSHFLSNTLSSDILSILADGDVTMDGVSFIDNVAVQSIVTIQELQSLAVSDLSMINNTAVDIVSVHGTNKGHVDINHFNFEDNNLDATDSNVLISLFSFVDLTISHCNLSQNYGEYVMKTIGIGDFALSNCVITNNDISHHMIHSSLSGGNLSLVSVDMTHNHNQNNSILSLVNASIVHGVSMVDVVLRNNLATRYLVLDGNWTGDVAMNRVHVLHNNNPNTYATDIAIDARYFKNMMIQNTLFFNNNHFDILFHALLNENVYITDTDFVSNNGQDHLININGVSSLNITNANISNNNVDNALQFYGMGSGNVDINRMELTSNNHDISSPQTILYLDGFMDISVSQCNAITNNANYFIQSRRVFGSALFDECILSSNNINNSVIEMVLNQGDFRWISSNITGTHSFHSINANMKSTELLFSIENATNLVLNTASIQNNNVTQIMYATGNDLGTLSLSKVDVINTINLGPLPDTVLMNAVRYRSAIIDQSHIINNKYATNIFLLSLSGGNMRIDDTLFTSNNAEETLLNVTGIMGLLNISFTTLESNDVSDMLVFNGMDSADLFIDTLTIQHNNRIVPGMSLLSLKNFEDVNIYNTMMRANNVKKYLIYGVLFGDAVMQNIKFIRNKVDFEIVRIFGDDSNNASASSITFGGVTIQDTRESSTNNVTQSLMSINGFGFVSFAMVNFTNNSAVNLLVFRLTGTEIDFADAIISDNVLENNLLDFSGQGSISLIDSNFNQNAANTLISSIGVDYNTDSLFLQLNTISFIDNDITKSVFEMGDVSADLLGMTLSENKLFINIISVVDIEIKESEIMDMSGIYMDATVNASMFGASKINISDSNFTARHFSSEYFGITSYMNPNDEIYVYRSEFKLLPIRIFANDLSGLSPINNENTALLFAECEFTDLNNRTAFKFESLGHHWYPNITFDTCLFNDTKLNVIETETIHDPLFYSSIILKQCTFEQVSGTAVFHTFIVPPIIHISFQSGTWQNYVLSTPFLIAKLSNSTYFPCTSLPQFVTHSLVDTIFIDNKIADGMFEVECSNIQFKNSIFIRNQELSGTKVGLIDVGGGNNVWIHNCTFQENQFNFVGLIYDYGDQIDETLNPLVSITDSTFISNSAPKGSIISVLYDNPSSSYEYFGPSYSINNSLFDSNIATDSGAIIYIDINDTNYDKQLQIHNCTIQNNIALNHGGAIYSKDFTISISSSMFENNSATISGGCIALMSDTCDYTTAALYVQNSSIIRSKASIGGAIIIGCSEMYITGGSNQITNNEASYRGGAIHSHHSCISSLAEAEVLFESNAADYGGDISFTGGVADGHSCNSELRANT
eukprot:1082721_1